MPYPFCLGIKHDNQGAEIFKDLVTLCDPDIGFWAGFTGILEAVLMAWNICFPECSIQLEVMDRADFVIDYEAHLFFGNHYLPFSLETW